MARIAKSGPGHLLDRVMWHTDSAAIRVYIQKQQMKRLIKFAALATMALMGTLPMAEGFACLPTMSAGTAACPMGMSEMSPSCPMGQMTAQSCGQDCCNHSMPKIAAPWATTAKPKSDSLHLTLMEVAATITVAEARSAAGFVPASTPSSPPRYILNRVFRI